MSDEAAEVTAAIRAATAGDWISRLQEISHLFLYTDPRGLYWIAQAAISHALGIGFADDLRRAGIDSRPSHADRHAALVELGSLGRDRGAARRRSYWRPTMPRTDVQLHQCWVSVRHCSKGGKRIHVGAHDPRVSPRQVVRLAYLAMSRDDPDYEVLYELLAGDSVSWEKKTRAQQITWKGADDG